MESDNKKLKSSRHFNSSYKKIQTRNQSFSLLVVGVLWPPETFLFQLIKRLADDDIKITIASHKKPDYSKYWHPNFSWLFTPHWEGSYGKRLLRLTLMLLSGTARSLKDTLFFASIARKMNKPNEQLRYFYRLLPFSGRRWDIIYFPWNTAAINYFPLFDLDCPIVISCRGAQINVAPHNPDRFEIRKGLKDTFHRSAAVHCVSEAIKHEAMNYGLDVNKTWIIRPSINSDFFCPIGSPFKNNSVFRIVTTGNLIWRKGYEYALLSIRRLIDNGIPVKFHIIGEGGERQRMLYTIQDLGLQGKVQLCGRFHPEKVREHLQAADVFLLSSLSEGISNAALEAMACGLPIVTADCGGMRELVTDGLEGFVVPVRDPEAMANALQILWEDVTLRKKMGQLGRKRVEKSFRLDQQVQQFRKLFESVILKN